MTRDPLSPDLRLALGCIGALVRLAQATTDSILEEAQWASRERIEDQLRTLCQHAQWTLTAATNALEPPPAPEDYTLSALAKEEPPKDHPAREFGPLL